MKPTVTLNFDSNNSGAQGGEDPPKTPGRMKRNSGKVGNPDEGRRHTAGGLFLLWL